jgi:hypothetical protein
VVRRQGLQEQRRRQAQAVPRSLQQVPGFLQGQILALQILALHWWIRWRLLVLKPGQPCPALHPQVQEHSVNQAQQASHPPVECPAVLHQVFQPGHLRWP